MWATRYKRQIVLFIAAILVPAAGLVGLSTQLMRQERELAVKRAADQRQASLKQLRRELGASLEAIRLGEVLSFQPGATRDRGNAAVVLTAAMRNGEAVMPWVVPRPEPSREFASRRQQAEIEEYQKNDPRAAASAYRAAVSSARSPEEVAEARLALARMLDAAGQPTEALTQLKDLLNDASNARDPEGVGYRFYAAQRLLDANPQADAVRDLLRREVESDKPLSLPELYTIKPMIASSGRLSQRIAEWEQLLALAKNAARIQVQVESGASWVPYGEEPLLVTVTPRQGNQLPLLVAVSSAKVTPPAIRLHTGTTQGEALGDAFPGVRVEFVDTEVAPAGPPRVIWAAGLLLVLGVAVFGGYLLLRDVNRDVHLTEVRSQFVASVSHELKTPLTAIRMFAETLAMGRGRDENTKAEYLETIVNESERLARLVDNVLDFSKIEEGKKIYRLRPTRLEDVAESAVRAMQFPLVQQGFDLRFSVAGEIPEIQADPDAIQQAILNLLTNAMKYSGDSRQIDLRLFARSGDAVIEVADKGLGMTVEERQHVFEKFYRAPSHESHLIAGTGLGLTLVAHIASGHRGRVEVRSEPGQGSTFAILIPIEARA